MRRGNERHKHVRSRARGRRFGSSCPEREGPCRLAGPPPPQTAGGTVPAGVSISCGRGGLLPGPEDSANRPKAPTRICKQDPVAGVDSTESTARGAGVRETRKFRVPPPSAARVLDARRGCMEKGKDLETGLAPPPPAGGGTANSL
jgi:hypothetical protein